jgi:arylsulfatase A-like enzyme
MRMTGRTWLLMVLVALGAACRSAPSGPPNVLLVVFDTARTDAFSYFGRGGTQTPVFDGIAAKGVVFPKARSTSAWTLPSHASLFTGLYPSRHGATHESHLLASERVTMAEVLAPTHETAGFSENPHIGRAKGFAQGFGHFDETWRLRGQRGEAAPTIEHVLEWLRGRGPASDRPFFLFINLMDPHLPYVPPEPFASQLASNGFEPERVRRMRDVNEREARLYMTGRLRFTPREFEILRALYDAEVAFSDSRAGRVLNELQTQGLLDHTLVILVADHGENIGEHELMEHQLCLYETLLRVPIAFRLPGVFEGGEVREAPAQLVDVPPTVFEVLGVPQESQPPMEGTSLLGNDPPATRPLYAEYMRPIRQKARFLAVNPVFDFTRFDRRLRSIQVGDLKLITSDRGDVELFDLSDDPGENVNLSEERPEVVETLKGQLGRWLEAGGSASPVHEPALDPETIEALRELGYME